MEIVKKTNRYTIFKKRSGRYGVRSAGGAWINGDDKIKILSDEGLIEVAAPKKEESSDDNTSAESAAEQEGETEEQKAEESSEENSEGAQAGAQT